MYGIDLGTTNSCISRIVDGKPQPIPIAGSFLVPSTVLYEENGKVVVGREARNLELQAPERCIRSVKRKMGGQHRYPMGDEQLAPEDVSAEILRELKRGAEEATGEAVRDVVITVPAYFDDAQRHATIRAGELAGLNILRLLNEPTSASLVYEQVGQPAEDAPTQLVMIYDLGGGTFDVSVLEVFEGVREVRATAGNTHLGGDDFDELLYRHFVDHLRRERGAELDARATARLRRLAESTKIALSRETELQVREEFLGTDDRGEPVHLELTVTRREFETMIRPLLTSTVELCRRAVDDARLEGQTIDRICLVGGSTRVPLVRALLAEAFATEIHEEVDPDLAVALGASLHAATLQGALTERLLIDVTAHSLGIRVAGPDDEPWEDPDTFAPVLRRNTVLPSERAEEFYTMVDEQERIKVDVFQGEHQRATQNRLIGSFSYELDPAPANTPVKVVFAYDLDGIVRVSITQQGTQNEKSVSLSLADTSLSEAASEGAVIRKARKLLPQLSGAARSTLSALIERHGAASAQDREQVEEEILDLLVEVEDDDHEDDES